MQEGQSGIPLVQSMQSSDKFLLLFGWKVPIGQRDGSLFPPWQNVPDGQDISLLLEDLGGQ